jgi:HD-GYP domain-containing protein (c-di-GMP phosphodiesterase class II)
MTSDPPSYARSLSPAGRTGDGPDLAALLRERGGPLLEALERHLPGSRQHAEATASYAFTAAVWLGFDRAQCDVAREATMLHEIGLIYVPAAVAAKAAGERTREEILVWDRQYESAYQLARGAGLPEQACSWLLRIRERYDGSGPERLAGERIPLESRLMRAACACQTALSAPAGDAPAARVAIAHLASRAGGDLDPRVVAALVSVLDRVA